MTRKPQETVVCQVCKKEKTPNQVFPSELVDGGIAKTIRKHCPDWSSSGFICVSDLNRLRTEYVQDILKTEKGELSAIDTEVVKSLREHELVSRNINAEVERQLTLGERLADKIAEFGGSWHFILGFAGVFLVWIAVNSVLIFRQLFDPYPFILLNLVLSGLAAVQAPIIMMSQNRQEDRDRLRAEHDYRVNLRAELEIRQLIEKLDHFVVHQWQRLLEIQEVQIGMMQGFARGTHHGEYGRALGKLTLRLRVTAPRPDGEFASRKETSYFKVSGMTVRGTLLHLWACLGGSGSAQEYAFSRTSSCSPTLSLP